MPIVLPLAAPPPDQPDPPTPEEPPVPSKAATIFGREPAAWVGLLESVLTVALAFGLGISQTTFGPIMAVVVALAGVYTAWATKDTMLGVIVGLAKAVLVLAAVYGLTLTDMQTGALIGLVALVVSFFQRTQTSPVLFPAGADGTQSATSLTPSPQPVVLTNAEGQPLAPIPGTTLPAPLTEGA